MDATSKPRSLLQTSYRINSLLTLTYYKFTRNKKIVTIWYRWHELNIDRVINSQAFTGLREKSHFVNSCLFGRGGPSG